MAERRSDLCIIGGGPAGMMAGLLFARAGVRTLVLEKHGDFLRDSGRLLDAREPLVKAPLAVRLLNRWPLLRRVLGRLIALGVHCERVRSPAARGSLV